MKTWHLICILAGITGVGVILITIKTIAQAVTEPELVRDSENPDGTTVQHYSLNNSPCVQYDRLIPQLTLNHSLP